MAGLSDKEEQYFMPALLNPAPIGIQLDEEFGKKVLSTLFIKFQDGFFPRSVFCCLIALSMQKNETWKLQTTTAYKDVVVFQIENNREYLILFDKLNHISVEIHHKEDLPPSNHQVLCYKLHENLIEVCNKIYIYGDFKFGFLCEKCESGESFASVQVQYPYMYYPETLLCAVCDHNPKMNYDQLMWFIPPNVVDILNTKDSRQLNVFDNNEKCPLKDCLIISRMFDYNGGELEIKEHGVKVTVPIGAIDKDCEAQIEVAASLLGPFMIPEDYYPISVYVWIKACYKFKKKLMVEMEHDIVVTKETDVSELCVLTACEEDKCCEENNQMLKMHEDTCEYKLEKSTCTIFTSSFCSKCLAAKKRGKAYQARRIIMYHYLPENYNSADEFVAEVCFCYDLEFCKKETEKRYIDRRMKQESSFPIQIFNWKEDKILLSYPEKLGRWEICHSGDDKIISDELNFRELGYSVSDLQKEEDNDRFPPRFRLKMVNTHYTPSEINLLYKYYIHVKSEGKDDKKLTLNICFGNTFPNKAKRKHERDEPSDKESESGVKSKKPKEEELSDSNEHHHKITHMKVYEKNLGKLVTVLPMDDVTFTTQLSSNKILPASIDAHIKSLPTESDKADYYLKHVIKKSLDIGETAELNNLITVMEKCGYAHVERMSEDMKSHLSI